MKTKKTILTLLLTGILSLQAFASGSEFPFGSFDDLNPRARQNRGQENRETNELTRSLTSYMPSPLTVLYTIGALGLSYLGYNAVRNYITSLGPAYRFNNVRTWVERTGNAYHFVSEHGRFAIPELYAREFIERAGGAFMPTEGGALRSNILNLSWERMLSETAILLHGIPGTPVFIMRFQDTSFGQLFQFFKGIAERLALPK